MKKTVIALLALTAVALSVPAGAGTPITFPTFRVWMGTSDALRLVEDGLVPALRIRMGNVEKTSWRNPQVLKTNPSTRGFVVGTVGTDTYSFKARYAEGHIDQVVLQLVTYARGEAEPQITLVFKLLGSADEASLIRMHEALEQALQKSLSRDWSLDANGLRTSTLALSRIGPSVHLTLNQLPEREISAALRAANETIDILIHEGTGALK